MSSAVVRARPDQASIFLPSSTLVPSMRTTTGSRRPSFFTAAITPSASRSQRRMPPKTLMKTALTLESEERIRNAFSICSGEAPPPTSRKLAGSPPASLMMSIVAIASPAPLTMHPTLDIIKLAGGEPANFLDDDVHRGHRQSRAVDHAPHVAVQLDVVEVE